MAKATDNIITSPEIPHSSLFADNRLKFAVWRAEAGEGGALALKAESPPAGRCELNTGNPGGVTPSRRALVAGLAAAVVPMPAVALAAEPAPDAELLDLVRRFNEIHAAFKAVSDRWDEASERAEALHPEYLLPVVEPLDVLMFGQRIHTLRGEEEFRAGARFTRRQILAIARNPIRVNAEEGAVVIPQAQQRSDELHALVAGLDQRREEIDRQVGAAAAKVECERLIDVLNDMSVTLAGTPARTIEGLSAKAQALYAWEEDGSWHADEIAVGLRGLIADLGVELPAKEAA
jgi:hypothetical protein